MLDNASPPDQRRHKLAQERSLTSARCVRRPQELPKDTEDRFELERPIALLRSTPAPQKREKHPTVRRVLWERRGYVRPRPAPIRDFIIRQLAEVDHWRLWTTGERRSDEEAAVLPRHALMSVGIPFEEIFRRVIERFPGSRTTGGSIRWIALHVRRKEPKFEGSELPDCRLVSGGDRVIYSGSGARPGSSRP
jgi:hypothetical protein